MTSPPEDALRGLHILVAEDEPLFAMSLDDLLTRAGATVAGPVASVAAGLVLLTRSPRLDAAILDVNLGGEMVYLLADRLLARKVPLVFCTDDRTDRSFSRFAGAPQLTKVVSDEEVIRAVIEAVSRG